jgi:hypothetical protein
MIEKWMGQEEDASQFESLKLFERLKIHALHTRSITP